MEQQLGRELAWELGPAGQAPLVAEPEAEGLAGTEPGAEQEEGRGQKPASDGLVQEPEPERVRLERPSGAQVALRAV